MRDVFLCMAGIQIHNECDPNRVTNEQNCSHFKIQNDTKQNKAQRSEIELYSQHVVCSIDIFSSLFAFPPILWIRLNRSHISCTLNIFLSLNRREQTRIYEYLKIFSASLHFVIKTRHFAATIVSVLVCARGSHVGNIHDNSLKCTFVFGCHRSPSSFLFSVARTSHQLFWHFPNIKSQLADRMAGWLAGLSVL